MDNLEEYRSIIEKVLLEYTKIPYAHGDLRTEAVFDRVRDRYLLMNVGWDKGKRVHGSIAHADIIDDKIWVQYDGLEEGLAVELIRAGIPKELVVLGFRTPEARKHIDYSLVS